MDNKIVKITLPNTKELKVIYSMDRINDKKETTLNELKCGPNDTLFFTRTDVTGMVPGSDNLEVRSIIMGYSLIDNKVINLKRVGDISMTSSVMSRDGKRMAARGVGYDKPDSLVIIDYKDGSIYQHPVKRWARPDSWDPSGEKLAVSISDYGEGSNIAIFDIKKKEFKTLLSGISAKYSLNGDRIAYIADKEQRKLVIADKDGRTIKEFNGFYKDIIQWINERYILYASGEMYNDYFGVLDIEREKSIKIILPEKGEIMGACWHNS